MEHSEETEETEEISGADNNGAVDDRGTSPAEGLEILKRLREQGFDGDSGKLSVALGRPVEEIERWMSGAEAPDDDIIMKARGIATQRRLEIG
ncbi:MAG: hypothetical protein WKF30_11595 [Pyrinomonadaceae bacterium]